MDTPSAAELCELGQAIRAQRLLQGVSLIAAAESIGVSRWTWHRIECGTPSVDASSFVVAAEAVKVELPTWAKNIMSPPAEDASVDRSGHVHVAEYPQLRALLWNRHGVTWLSPVEALTLYERHWRHVDKARLDDTERDLLDRLVTEVGGRRLLA